MFISDIILRAIMRTSNAVASSLNSLPQGKVMFSEASACSLGAGGLPLMGAAFKGGGLPPEGRGLSNHCSGRYASYWNAFLFSNFFNLILQLFLSLS